MQESTPLSKEQALYLRCIQRNMEAARVLFEQCRERTVEQSLWSAMYTCAMAAEEKANALFPDLRVWGGPAAGGA
ncbi:hypothetical protein ACFO3A_12825 [Comamonas nitrativorans]|uniref:HEPN domain-containing protein n=1 Tax=Comamonas nitrativorans TaxID=108437 RepID=A0ABV9GZX8_9BURK